MASTKTNSKTTAAKKVKTAPATAKKSKTAAAKKSATVKETATARKSLTTKKSAPAAAKQAGSLSPRSVKGTASQKSGAAPGKTGAKTVTGKAKTAGASKVKKSGAPETKGPATAKTQRAATAKTKASEAKSAKGVSPKDASAKAASAKGISAKGVSAKDVLDFGEFPAGLVTRHDVTLCLACIFRLFTNQLGLAPRTAYNEIRRYAPTVEELTAREPQRPFFKPLEEKNAHCPYCDASKRWHALVSTYRVEGGKATDAARRSLARKLTTKDEQFQIHEEKKTAQQVFFEWLERLGQELDFEDDSAWMIEVARTYLRRREPKTDWVEAFGGVRAVRRSQRLGAGWERDGARVFIAPTLYNDVLLVQYLVSRSHRHGGRTFEGRLTLPEMVRRMRYGGHLEAQGITDRDQFDVLEQLVERLTGGDEAVKLHFIIDRRDLLDKVKDIANR